jgi:bleomycin hydrolase
MKQIELNELEELRNDYLEDTKARVVRNALTNNDVSTISSVFEATMDNPNLFSIDIETMPVTNQQASGRCWIFSAMNVLREMIAKKYNIEKFELSQNYIAFYDKLEKVNFFLECAIQEKDSSLSSETMRYLLETAVGDGGQWDMVVSIVKKYGICPKTAMPETYQSSHTRNMNGLLNRRLRKFTADIRNENVNVVKLKKECLRECYTLLCDCFGVPPQLVTFEYVEKESKEYKAYRNITPLEFYKEFLKEDLDNYVTIIHAPTKDKPYHKTYTVKYLGNVVNGNEICFLNVPMDEFKSLVLSQLKDKQLVWFGCDCGKDGNRTTGLWDDKQYDYESTFDMQLNMSKEDMLDTRESVMNHAMVLTGVNLVDDKPTRWKIENSWGDKTANEGYFICSDTWFDKYMYEAAINKKYLTTEQLNALEEIPTVLNSWDPFGSLAD